MQTYLYKILFISICNATNVYKRYYNALYIKHIKHIKILILIFPFTYLLFDGKVALTLQFQLPNIKYKLIMKLEFIISLVLNYP